MAKRSGFRNGMANWRDYDASAARKARLVTRNTWHKLRHRSSCCGNHGEPGC